MKFDELRDLLKEKFGIDHLADIAREVGVSPQAVSNWKARDRVPYKYVRKLRQQNIDNDDERNEGTENNVSNSDEIISQEAYMKNFDEETISLIDLLLIIGRNIKIIITAPIIFCIIAIFYGLYVAQPVYESTAKIMSSSSSASISQASGFAAQFGINLPTASSETVWAYSEIIKSRTLARAMLKRKFDTEKFGPQKPLFQILTYGNNNPEFGKDTLELLAIDSFINMIELSEDKTSGIYTITLSASEPKFVKDLTAALLEQLDAHQRDYNKAKTSETRKFIESRISDTRLELEISEEDLKDFNNRNRRIENSPALQLERQRLAREVSVLTGVFTTLKQQLETAKIEEVKESDYVIVLDPPETPLTRSRPKRKQMVLIAGIFGIFFGIVIGLLTEYFKNSLKDDPEKINQLKSLIMNDINDLVFFRFNKK